MAVATITTVAMVATAVATMATAVAEEAAEDDAGEQGAVCTFFIHRTDPARPFAT